MAVNYSDPFERHLLQEIHPNLWSALQAVSHDCDKYVKSWPELGEFMVEIPSCSEDESPKKSKPILEDEVHYTKGGVVPHLSEHNVTSSNSKYIKQQIVNSLMRSKSEKSDEVDTPLLTSFQNELFNMLNNYNDLYFMKRTMQNAESIRFVYCLHILNHMLKTRSKIVSHNAQVTKSNIDNDCGINDEFRDQGLVRPKILILVPLKDCAYKIMSVFEQILFPEKKGNIMNKLRFQEEFTGNELVMPYINEKPTDFVTTFSGNISDDFKIGISVTKKALKLYVDFYSADIIIASPLGLRRIIGAEGEAERDFDFLASIEILVLDQAELFLMQNWGHVIHIFDHLHIVPKESHGTDLSRVRLWNLNGRAKHYRQTLLFSSVNLPEFMSLMNKKCFNYEGKVKLIPCIENGSISLVFRQLHHRFYKFMADNPQEASDRRFDFFLDTVLPRFQDSCRKETLIFIPDYFDFVRLRNHFKKEAFSFTQICEYSKPEKVARARDLFFNNDLHFMLYTERYHFYNRIKLRGIRHLIFYKLPTFPHFYSEMCNLLCVENLHKSKRYDQNFTVNIIFSKYDVYQLSAVVGTERAQKMLDSRENFLISGE